LLVKEYFEIEKKGLAMRLGKEGGKNWMYSSQVYSRSP